MNDEMNGEAVVAAADTVAVASAADGTVAAASAAADGTVAAASAHCHVTATAHSTPQTTDAAVGVHLAVAVCPENKIVYHCCPYLVAPYALQSPSPCSLTLQHPIPSSYIPFLSLPPFLSSSSLSLLLLFVSSSPVLQPASSGLPRLTLYCNPGALVAPYALQSPSPCSLTLQHPIPSSYIPFISLLPFLSSSPLSLLLLLVSSSPVLQPASSGLPRLTLYYNPGALQSSRYRD